MAIIEKSHVVDVEITTSRSSGTGEPDAYFDTGDRSDNEQRCLSRSGTEIVGVSDKERGSPASECSAAVDLERGRPEIKVHLAKVERDCRICHLSLELDASNLESGVPIELGCSCKDDLAAAHKQCAEAWFKIKGNK